MQIDDALRARFMKYVKRARGDKCWLWTGARLKAGYGNFTIDGRRGHRVCTTAHRVAWMLEHGPIPEGMYVLHSCDNPPCVRADHLYLGSQSQNIRDMYGRGRRNVKLTRADVDAIRANYERGDGITQRQLASEYGVSPALISMVIRGLR